MNASDVMNDIIWKEKNIQINQSEYHHRIHFLSIRSSTHCPSLHRSDNPYSFGLAQGPHQVALSVQTSTRATTTADQYHRLCERHWTCFHREWSWKKSWMTQIPVHLDRTQRWYSFRSFLFFLLDIKHNPDSSIFHGKRICSGPSLCESPSWRW